MKAWARKHLRTLVWSGLLGVCAVAFIAWYFQPQKLFINKTVNEPFPVVVAQPATPTSPLPKVTSTSSPGSAGVLVLATGQFRSRGHHGSGTVGVVELLGGKRVLRLQDLDVSNGPDLRVLLSKESATAGNDVIARGALDVGALKGNRGNQTYPIPDDVQLTGYRSVLVWCRRFTYVFAAAALTHG